MWDIYTIGILAMGLAFIAMIGTLFYKTLQSNKHGSENKELAFEKMDEPSNAEIIPRGQEEDCDDIQEQLRKSKERILRLKDLSLSLRKINEAESNIYKEEVNILTELLKETKINPSK